MPEEQTGQGPESPTGEGNEQDTQGQVPGSPPGEGVSPGSPTGTDESGGEGAGTSESDLEFIEKDGVKYYRSFDKHPEWRTLKDTKSAIDSILEDHGFTSMEELTEGLKSGLTLAELIGTTDANKVQDILDKAQKWDSAEEYWAEQEAKEKEAKEKKKQKKRKK